MSENFSFVFVVVKSRPGQTRKSKYLRCCTSSSYCSRSIIFSKWLLVLTWWLFVWGLDLSLSPPSCFLEKAIKHHSNQGLVVLSLLSSFFRLVCYSPSIKFSTEGSCCIILDFCLSFSRNRASKYSFDFVFSILGRISESVLGCVSSLRSTFWLWTSWTAGWRLLRSSFTGERVNQSSTVDTTAWSWPCRLQKLWNYTENPNTLMCVAACTVQRGSARTHVSCRTWWQCVWLRFTPVMKSSSTGQSELNTMLVFL